MKCKLSLLLIYFVLNIHAQGTADKMIYLDSLHLETVSENHPYYRIIKNYFSEQPLQFYRVSDYYASGKIEMTGTSAQKDYVAYEGQFVYYYESGNKKSSTYYKDSRPIGSYFEWYENGNPKIEGEYVTSKSIAEPKSNLRIFEYWGPDNILKVTGGNGEYNEVTDDENSSGRIKDGFKDGLWRGANKKLRLTYSETYANQQFVSGISIDADQNKNFYTVIESKAEPAKGIDDFRKYLSRNFKIPAVEHLQGRIISTFVIDKEGNITDIVIRKSIGYGTDKEMIRVLKSYPHKWKPGVLRGKKVKMQYSIPLNIQSQ